MKSRATLLLILVALLLVLVILFQPISAEFSHWAKIFLQAALVGALADWFAVVALFRHPLGLPIPHTAIIPANRERIASALGSFVQSNFLAPQVLADKVLNLKVGDELAAWLQSDTNRERLVRLVAPAYSGLLSTFDDPALRGALARATGQTLRGLDVAQILSRFLEVSVIGHADGLVGDAFLRWLEQLLDRHETQLRDALRHEMPWYVPNFVHDKVYRDVVRKIRQSLAEANRDPKHEFRTNVAQAAQRFAVSLRDDETMRTAIKQRWLDVLDSRVLVMYVERILGDLRQHLVDDLKQNPQTVNEILGTWFKVLAGLLSGSQEIRNGVSALAANSAEGIATHYREELANLVTETVKRWDTRTIVEKIESHVGEDLQFIRINGTLVGGLVGVLLELLLARLH